MESALAASLVIVVANARNAFLQLADRVAGNLRRPLRVDGREAEQARVQNQIGHQYVVAVEGEAGWKQ